MAGLDPGCRARQAGNGRFLSVHLPDIRHTRVVTRSGSVSFLANPDIAAVQTCKSVIVLSHCPESSLAEAKIVSDTRVIQTLRGVMASLGEDSETHVVAELFEDRSRAVAEEISGRIVTISTSEILAKILVQTSRSIGLSVVYGEIMSFDGCEMYFYNDDWNGRTFGQIQFHFPDGVPMGIRKSDGTILVNPPVTTAMDSNDDVLILADDDSSIEYRSEPVVLARDLSLPDRRLEQQVEQELILGWNAKAPILLILRKIFAQADPQARTTKLISEVLDSRNHELVARAGVHDFIVSNRLVSMLLAQISEESDIHRVYKDLFEEEGSEIYLKPARLYQDRFPVELTFADMMALAKQRGEICIGVKIKRDEKNLNRNFGVKLIPPKDTRYAMEPEDCLIVVAEDET